MQVALFVFNQTGLKTLVVQCNYVYGVLEVHLEKARLLEKELIVKDSIIQALKTQVEKTDERLSIYSSGYQDLKAVANRYDSQTKALIEELELIQRNDRRTKRKAFSKGMIAGLIGGVAITSFFIASRN